MLIELAIGDNNLIQEINSNDIIVGLDNDNAINGNAGDDILVGGIGNDIINGGDGNDIITGGSGIDTLTGGNGKDKFLFSDDPFSNGTPTPTASGISVLNQPDVITDYQIGTDKLAFNKFEFDLDKINFQKGISSQLAGDSNVLVLLDPFTNAGEAAKAIADNQAIATDDGLFVYFNSTLGFSRIVFSEDLSDGGAISILGNLTNLVDSSNQADFSSQDFQLFG